MIFRRSWAAAAKSFARFLIEVSCEIVTSLTTSRTPLISHASLVAVIFCSCVGTIPVSKTAPSFTVIETPCTKSTSSLRNLSASFVLMTPSATDVEKPFSVEEAATAAVPTPTRAGAHALSAKLRLIKSAEMI